jgi:hypothetical protein
MKFSSANIPAVSFVITAPICRRAATKEITATGVPPGFDALRGGQKPSQRAGNSSPIPAKPLNCLSKHYCK